MLLIIDNYNSFVFNIARYCEELGQKTSVVRNDAIALDDIRALNPTSIIISPGPRTPTEAGISLAIVAELSVRIPILGVCLGHQCIGAVFGGAIVGEDPDAWPRVDDRARWRRTVRGVADAAAGRPISFADRRVARPMLQALKVDATAEDGEVMALSHRCRPTFGVQFHPESILTEHGHALLANFFQAAERWTRDRPAERPGRARA